MELASFLLQNQFRLLKKNAFLSAKFMPMIIWGILRF